MDWLFVLSIVIGGTAWLGLLVWELQFHDEGKVDE